MVLCFIWRTQNADCYVKMQSYYVYGNLAAISLAMALSPLKVSVAVGKINLGGSSQPENKVLSYVYYVIWF